METVTNPQETETFWRNHIETYRESKQSKAAYTRAQGLRYTQFLYWFEKLAKTKEQETKWLPLKISSSVGAPVLASIRMGNGYCMEIHDIQVLTYLLGKK